MTQLDQIPKLTVSLCRTCVMFCRVLPVTDTHLCCVFRSPPLQNTRKPRPWSRTGRWGLTGKGRRSGNLGPFTPACSSRRWTSASSRPSTSPCQRGQTWQPNWAWHKPRYCAGRSCLLLYVENINPSDMPLCFYSKARLTFVNFLW